MQKMKIDNNKGVSRLRFNQPTLGHHYQAQGVHQYIMDTGDTSKNEGPTNWQTTRCIDGEHDNLCYEMDWLTGLFNSTNPQESPPQQ